ncbi:MAG: site-specific DNA-methyltransferase [Candidatus Eremiobacteraeota bacterium]|nr:site-specific DNA-methyltransferase [Candidatus Eremiobacteraeota bacterium]
MFELYHTKMGKAFVGDSLDWLHKADSNSVDLVITSPPFALQRKKEYGNEDQAAYVDWIIPFGHEIFRVLKDTGSFILDLGGAYKKGKPVRSLYNYRVLIRMCDGCGFNLAEEFFWHNPSKLPSPIEWVNKRKIRVKDSVNTVWWFSKTDFPRADVRKVLVPYSDRMKKLLENPDKFYKPKKRPSGHDISRSFGNNKNGGAIPPNLLQIPNSESNSQYLRLCKEIGAKRHPARFPSKLPAFFIDFLTNEGDLVVDIFAGSNTTGEVAGKKGRRWIACDLNREYLAASCFRFFDHNDYEKINNIYELLLKGKLKNLPADIEGQSLQVKQMELEFK